MRGLQPAEGPAACSRACSFEQFGFSQGPGASLGWSFCTKHPQPFHSFHQCITTQPRPHSPRLNLPSLIGPAVPSHFGSRAVCPCSHFGSRTLMSPQWLGEVALCPCSHCGSKALMSHCAHAVTVGSRALMLHCAHAAILAQGL